jgi:hypothetical protein
MNYFFVTTKIRQLSLRQRESFFCFLSQIARKQKATILLSLLIVIFIVMKKEFFGGGGGGGI